jgi:endonuclease III
MTKKERYQHILAYFEVNAPEAETELAYANPYELLVAVILSAQCTDKRVNLTTPALFQRFPTVYDLAKASSDEVFTYIRSISYPNNKAKHLVGMAQRVVDHFNGEIPSAVKDLQTLQGVGRKTANVIASVVFNQPTMAVDTHVFRVSKRMGLVTQTAKTPLEVEKQLMKYLPTEQVHIAHHWLILHGRYVCTARSPQCDACALKAWCAYYARTYKAS